MTIHNGNSDISVEIRRLQKALNYWAEFDPEQGPRIERAVADINRRLERLMGTPALLVPLAEHDDELVSDDEVAADE